MSLTLSAAGPVPSITPVSLSLILPITMMIPAWGTDWIMFGKTRSSLSLSPSRLKGLLDATIRAMLVPEMKTRWLAPFSALTFARQTLRVLLSYPRNSPSQILPAESTTVTSLPDRELSSSKNLLFATAAILLPLTQLIPGLI
jgi:hypothetical protein